MSDTSTPIDVLHVDDDPDFVETAARLLEREDGQLRVATATSAGEALAYLEEDTVDCIVSDFEMPGEDGIGLLESVRGAYPDLPFILYTGRGSEAVASEAISAGVTDYLQKEAGTEQFELLANRITNAVSQARAETELAAQRDRFQSLFERLDEPVVELDNDPDGPVVRAVNPAFERVFGYDAEDIVGEPLDAYIVPEEFEAEADRLNELVGRGADIEAREVTRKTVDGNREFLLQTAIYDDESSGGFSLYTDITDRKAREHELERLTELFKQAEEIADIGAWETDFVANEGWWSTQVNRIYGLPEAYQPDPSEGFEYFHPEDRPTIREAFEEAREDGEPYDLELRVRRDGDVRWVRAMGVPQLEEGEVVALRGTLQDITEQKQRERELQRQNARLSGLFEHFPEPTCAYSYDDEGRPLVRGINAAFIDVFGYEEAEAVGRPIDDLIVPSDLRTEAERIGARVEAGEMVDEELERAAADGRRRFRFRNIQLAGDPEIDGFAIYADVTARHEREQTLETLHGAATEIQTAETVEAASQRTVAAAEAVLDFELCSILLHRDGHLEPIAMSEEAPADGARRVSDDQGLAGKTYQTGQSHVIDDISSDDESDPAKESYRSGMSVPIGSVGVFQAVSTQPAGFDDTDVEFAEVLLAHTAAAIDRLQYAEELRASRATLQRQNERLERFVNLLSHDLQSPLNVAMGQLELAREAHDDEHLAAVARAHDRIGTLVDGLLELAREGQPIDTPTTVNLADLVESCWTTVETEDGTLSVETSQELLADEDRLRRLLENLIRNAVQHAGPAVRITVGDLNEGFYVADDGPGITREQREQVFEYGYSASEDGTGFGLAMVQEVAEAHDWSVEITESADGGARFEVTGVEPATNAD